MPDPAPAPHAGGQEPRPRLFPGGRRWLWFLLGLLGLNLLLSFATGGPPSRERVPYQPFFVGQVGAGNVREISSRGDSLEGELVHKARYDPLGDAKPKDVKRFKTEIPAFINRAGLTQLLGEKKVVINAEPVD